MPKHKSAIKRLRQSKERRVRNRIRKSKMRTAVKGLTATVSDSRPDNTTKVVELYRRAVSAISKTASKGTIHKRTAARKISRLTKAINKALGPEALAGEPPSPKVGSVFEAEPVPETPVPEAPGVEKPEPAVASNEEPTARGTEEAAMEPTAPLAPQEASKDVSEETTAVDEVEPPHEN